MLRFQIQPVLHVWLIQRQMQMLQGYRGWRISGDKS